MNFFGVGLPELAVIFIIATIVLGPERIPEVASALAKAIKYLRGFATDATGQMRAELSELTREYDAVRRELTEFRQTVTSDLAAMTRDVASMGDEASRTLQDAQQPAAEPGSAAAVETQPAPPDAGPAITTNGQLPYDTLSPIVEPGGEPPPQPRGGDGQPSANQQEDAAAS